MIWPLREADYDLRYSDEQPRDDHGRWTSDGGGSTTAETPAAHATGSLEGHHSAAMLKAIDSVRQEISPLGHERAIILNAQGERIFAADGTDHSVKFSAEDVATQGDSRGGVLLHNHPRNSGSGFSSADVVMASRLKVGEMRLFSDGYTYVMRPSDAPPGSGRTVDGWPSVWDMAGSIETARGEWLHNNMQPNPDFNALYGNQPYYVPKEGGRSIQDIDRNSWHEIMGKVATKYGLEYFRVANP